MVKPSFFLLHFLAQVLVVLAVLGLFRIYTVKEASLYAGILFVTLGTWLLLRLDLPHKWSLSSYYLTYAHLFAFSIPLLIFRISFGGKSLREAHLLGIPGELVHKAATYCFFALMVTTLIDAFRTWRKLR